VLDFGDFSCLGMMIALDDELQRSSLTYSYLARCVFACSTGVLQRICILNALQL
jgi:hypothetical protein